MAVIEEKKISIGRKSFEMNLSFFGLKKSKTFHSVSSTVQIVQNK